MSLNNQIPSVSLNNGQSIPIVGLGTYEGASDGTLYRAVRTAIECGYRHIDCAWIYKNQVDIGRAVNDAIDQGQIKRQDMYLVSKVWPTYYQPDRVQLCIKQILAELNTPYLDLCLLHWPMSFAQIDSDQTLPTGPDGQVIDGQVDYLDAWRELESAVGAGLVKSIGISNFNSIQIDRLLASCHIKPVTNQVEVHPYLAQKQLKQFCDDRAITLTAYRPLGKPNSKTGISELLNDPVIKRLAVKYGKNSGQILIKFQAQRGVIVIPKSVSEDRIRSNIQIFDFELTADEIKELEALDRNYRSCAMSTTSHLPDYPFNITF